MTLAECEALTNPTTDDWLACSGHYLGPVMDTVEAVVMIAVTIAIIFAGLRLAKKIVRQFGG